MVRNKFFKRTRFVPRGTPNRIEVSLIGDADAATQKVTSGQADYSNAAIPPDRIADAKSKGHLVLRQTANTYYFWMNIREAPFNKLKVRQAVNMAIDRKAMQTLVSGGHAQAGGARWLEDCRHPLDWFDVLLNGNRITDQDNNNYAWYKNKKTDKAIEQLKKAPLLTPAVNAKWATVEKQIMQQAPWAPWSNRVFPEFFTKQIGCIHIQRLYGIDLARLCRK